MNNQDEIARLKLKIIDRLEKIININEKNMYGGDEFKFQIFKNYIKKKIDTNDINNEIEKALFSQFNTTMTNNYTNQERLNRSFNHINCIEDMDVLKRLFYVIDA